ncbi:MAG: type II secretion system protein GspM [Thermoleophilia bacterium]|jgi:type II secretory pathway component PulM|nr:type II secretion system protein GspM [Thermoleophilia bacterium]
MKISKRDKLILAGLLLAVLLGGVWYFSIRPAGAEIAQRRDEIATTGQRVAELTDTLTRMQGEKGALAARAAESLRMAKAVPDSPQVPGALVQLERLAARSDVRLEEVSTSKTTPYGEVTGTQFQVRVSGDFFDVDDFLYRMHDLVGLDERVRPQVGGRLLALTGFELGLAPEDEAQAGAASGAARRASEDRVQATLDIVAFSRTDPAAGGAAGATAPGMVNPNVGTAPAAPAPSGGATQ